MGKLKVGDWVEVKSKEEILQTLDKNGRLDELPFMPQMFQYCGKRFKVYKSAHKTCDTITSNYFGRRLEGGIHLDLRCDGQAYGGCQAACLIFWKDAWLRRVNEYSGLTAQPPGAAAAKPACTEQDVYKGTTVPNQPAGSETRYLCQATHLIDFTKPLAWYDVRQYFEDYRSGNVGLGRIVSGFIYVAYYYGSLAYRGRAGIPGRWLYNLIQSLWGGTPFPRENGFVPLGQLAPAADLNLQPGDLVRIKSFDEIRKTIDTRARNRGMAFDAELVPFCGGTYRVKTRVSKFVDEKTGKMMTMKTPAVILEGVFCQARYSSCRMLCPRSIYSWWREIWLEKVQE
jgi:hypothetical protein